MRMAQSWPWGSKIAVKKKKKKILGKIKPSFATKFFTYRQQERQNFHDFVTELIKLSSECEFDNIQDSLIMDMIVCGTKDNLLRERLLRECDLTLCKAISAGLLLRKHVSMPAKF